MKYDLATTEDTEQFGATLWSLLPTPCVIFLQGDLGAGKTTLVRGLLRAAGHTGAVKSPTFTLVEEYDIAGRKIFHFDLYRLNDPEELEWIGIRDYFQQNTLCFIEWSEKGAGFLPHADALIQLSIKGLGRELSLEWTNSKKSSQS
jgi:tRNA threonylcarbamoyladenosine biosynthesis protein TsaE